MSQLCSIRHDIPVTLHTPEAYGQWSVFDHNGGKHLAVLGTKYGTWWPWYGQLEAGWLQPTKLLIIAWISSVAPVLVSQDRYLCHVQLHPRYQQVFSRKLPQKNRPSLVHIMACRPIGLHWLGLDTKDPRYSPVARENNRWPWFPRIFRIVYHFASSVNDLDTVACPSVSTLGAIAIEFGMDITVTYGTFSITFILVTTDVMGDSWCGRFGLWPFRSVAVSVCGRSGLRPFRFVAVSVCGRFGLWPFRFVAVSVCGRSGLWPFRFVAVSVVAVSVCGCYDLLPMLWWRNE